MVRSESFYGTEIETYYVDAKGRAWLIQSPEMGGDIVAVSADSAVGDELAHSTIDAEVFELAAKLDRVPRGEGGALAARYLDSLASRFEVQWLDAMGTWQNPGCSSREATFDSEEEAEAAIASLRRTDVEWEGAEFRVVKS